MCTKTVKLILISDLLPIEDYSKKRSLNIEKKILKQGVWTKPIVVEKNHMLILDGHHRFSMSKRLGFKKIPAILIDYDNVFVRSLRKDIIFTKNDIIENAKKGKIYPYKTVKHDLGFSLPNIYISLKELQ